MKNIIRSLSISLILFNVFNMFGLAIKPNPTSKTPSIRKMSWPLSFWDASPYLDGTLAGDLGFDPFRTIRSEKELFARREAEIKHGRIALLAALGWPLSELYHYTIANMFGLEDLLAPGDKAPSVLNGGLDNQYVLFGLGTFFAVGAILEIEMIRRKKDIPEPLQNFYDMWNEEGWDTPGNYGFDPLRLGKLFCKTNKDRVFMQSIEIFNARLAMLAVVGYVTQEAVTGKPIIEETPEFFHPFL